MLTVNVGFLKGSSYFLLLARTKVVLFLHFRIKGLRGHAFMQITKILLFVFAVVSLDKSQSQSISTVSG